MANKLGVSFELPLGCNIFTLRCLNVAGMFLLAEVLGQAYKTRNPVAYRANPVLFQHNVLNKILFPPLFFFSALYYTDIWSTLFVVLFYVQFVKTSSHNVPTLGRFLKLLILGLASLAFRQTNIFWVAVFPAAITFVQHINHGHEAVRDSLHRGVEGFGDTLYNVAKTSWKMEVVYDRSVSDASLIGTLPT